MPEQMGARHGRLARELSADAGYFSEDNLKELSRRQIRRFIEPGKLEHGDASRGNGRRKPRPWGRQMSKRLRQGGRRSRYRLRKQTVEPFFAPIEQAREFRQFLLRGRDNVAGEWSFLCTGHNILKLAGATRWQAGPKERGPVQIDRPTFRYAQCATNRPRFRALRVKGKYEKEFA